MEGALQTAVGRNLKAIRKGMGLSQEQMAEHLDWHRTYVGAVERGERNLTLRSVERLAAQLEIDPVSLFHPPAPEA